MSLGDAYRDLKYFLNRGYRKKNALEFVANHYTLGREERHLLARCVFSDSWIRAVSLKLLPERALRGRLIGIDGFNVLITLESLFEGRAILCEDGLVRDLKLQRGYRLGPLTLKVIGTLATFLEGAGVRGAVVIYDSPVSKSGEVAKLTRKALEERSIPGEVRLSRAPDHELKTFDVVATSDVGIIERVPYVVDIPSLAGEKLGLRAIPFLKLLENPEPLRF
ncbi:DUF434 domain-containing protein [Palaeococcus ferrophilus]|uniref:DUF434 domain-containing protein n=1 Tax=Palaeococcus ferrophilus TaxID=83868 RepID=UPI00064F163F|nr:DUF434 domain-containing protein [Palaeococcus ferrophilus]